MSLPDERQRNRRRYQLLKCINDETTLVGLIPSDVWSHIFFILTHPPVIIFDDMVGHRSLQRLANAAFELQKRYGDTDLRSVSQVCRTWREIAIGTPELWRHVNFSFPTKWLHLKMARSKAAPLHMSVGLGARISADYLFVDRSPRIVHGIEVIIPPGSRARRAAVELTQDVLMRFDADSMRSVSVCIGNSRPYNAPLPVIPIHPVQGDVDSKRSSLRTVILHGCLVDNFSHPLFANVTRLSVGQLPHPLSGPSFWLQSAEYRYSVPSSFEWITVLEHMPHLTHLHVQGMVVAASQPTAPQVMLPDLIELSLIDAHMGGGVCELFYGISAKRAGSLYLSVSPVLDKELDGLLVKGLQRWFARWPHPLPDPGTVGILSGHHRFLIHNSTNKSGLRFHIAHQKPAGGRNPFNTHAMQFIIPVINGVTDLKLMKGKHDEPLPVVFTSKDDRPFWNVQRLTLLERPGPWKRKKCARRFQPEQAHAKKWLPYWVSEKISPIGRSNLDFPHFDLFPALQEIRYLPKLPAALRQKSNHYLEILRFVGEFLHVESSVESDSMSDAILTQKSELDF